MLHGYGQPFMATRLLIYYNEIIFTHTIVKLSWILNLFKSRYPGKARYFLLLGFLIIWSLGLGQVKNYSLSGYVYDIDSGEPLPGAEIMIHELVQGTISGLDGSFTFKNLKPARYHIHIRFVGYHSSFEFVNVDRDLNDLKFELKASYLELMEVVVESDPFKTGPVEKSLTVVTVSDDFIKKNPGGALMSSLQKLPGINAINMGTGIAKPVIRGLSFNRVIVSDRGIKQEGQQWGADHGLEIDQFSTEQIEIIKGPASLQYGSDGLGGILIINPPYLAREGNLSGQVVGIYKSNNHLYGGSAMVKGNNNGLVYQIRLSSQDFGDYMVPADSFNYNGYQLPIYNNKLKNTAGRERNFTVMGGIKKNWGFSTITVSNFNQYSGLFPGATGIPREYNLNDDGDPRNIDLPAQRVNHLKVTSNSNVLIGQDWLDANIGYQHNHRIEEGVPHAHGYEPTQEGNLALGLDLHTYSANVKYSRATSNDAKRVYGIQYQFQENFFEGYEFLLPAFTASDLGIFIHEQRNYGEKISLNGGLRFDFGRRNVVEHYEPDFSTPENADSLERNPNINKSFYNGSGAIGISYFPNHEINIKLNVGSSFRIPTPSELAVNGIHHGTFRHERGNPDLNPERGWQIDINASYHQKQFYISATPFLNYYTGYIYLKPTAEFSTLPGGGQIFQYTQNDAIYMGSELSIDYHLFKYLHIDASLEYVWNYNINTRLPLPFTPPFSSLIELEYRIPREGKKINDYFINAGIRATAAQNRVDRNENATPGYTLVHAGAGTSVKVGNQPLSLLISVQNLFNTSYMNHLSRYRWLNLPEQGRNFNFTVIYSFDLK